MQPLEQPTATQRDQIERPDLAPDAGDRRALRAALRHHPRSVAQRRDTYASLVAFVVALLVHAGFLTAAALAPEEDRTQLRRQAHRRVLEVLRVEHAAPAPKELPRAEVRPPAPPPEAPKPAEPPAKAVAVAKPPQRASAPPPAVAKVDPPKAPKPPKRGKPKRAAKKQPAPLAPTKADDVASTAAPEAPPAPEQTAAATAPDADPEGNGGTPDGAPDGTGVPSGDQVGDGAGTGEGPGDGVGEQPTVDARALLRKYIRQVGKALKRDFSYPRAAVRQGLQGTVVLELVIDGDGHVREARIARSSGHGVLDEAALEAVRRVTRVPRPPSELEWDRRAVQVPFHYKLG